MLAWQTQQAPELSLGHLAIDFLPVALAQTKFDLTLSIAPDADGAIRGMLEYDASLFTDHRVAQWATWFERTMAQTQALSAATTPVDTLSLLDHDERHQVLDLFNQTEMTSATYNEDVRSSNSLLGSTPATLPELFDQQVTRTPEAKALVFGEQTLSYAELDARANQLARHLISLGIGPERIVALALPRSVEMIVALLAVLKSGAAYLPLDPDYPSTRLAFTLIDSQASLVIAVGDLIAEAIREVIQKRHTDNTAIAVLDLSDQQIQIAL
jgi:nonribosomal peptide synthetase DhbF